MTDPELLMIICVGSSVILGMLGGFKWKFLKRFVLPLILGIVAHFGGFPLEKCLYFTLSLSVALHLPYGEKTPYFMKILTFGAIFGSTCFLGWSWYQLIGTLLTGVLFKISNTKWGQNIVFHKAWEAITFGLLGLTISHLIAIGR